GQAEFTTFIPPKNKVADSVKAVVAAVQKAQVDSSVKTQLTNMKTWVDSAAGLAPIPAGSAANDTVASTLRPTSSPKPVTVPPKTPSMSMPATTTLANGTRAPSTATNLPLLLALGGLMVFVGVTLVGTKPKAERVRANRTDESQRARGDPRA